MTKPVGAGVILVKIAEENGEPLFLVLRGADTGVWSFSKGHPEDIDNDDLLTTAIRETREETGFVAWRDYCLLQSAPIRYGKRPYWIGIMTNKFDTPKINNREHDMARWCTASEIEALRSNVDVRMWTRKIKGYNNAFQLALTSSVSLSVS